MWMARFLSFSFFLLLHFETSILCVSCSIRDTPVICTNFELHYEYFTTCNFLFSVTQVTRSSTNLSPQPGKPDPNSVSDRMKDGGPELSVFYHHHLGVLKPDVRNNAGSDCETHSHWLTPQIMIDYGLLSSIWQA